MIALKIFLVLLTLNALLCLFLTYRAEVRETYREDYE